MVILKGVSKALGEDYLLLYMIVLIDYFILLI